ncbi:hypothetical protein BAC3_01975 [uncultured bacterium]|nr:hypothetical protein BAC3_01975 [uncultured bacterium]
MKQNHPMKRPVSQLHCAIRKESGFTRKVACEEQCALRHGAVESQHQNRIGNGNRRSEYS